MSQFADAVARLTIDKDFARTTRREPDKVAVLYGLNAEEAAKLRELAGAAVTDRTGVLSALLSIPAGVSVPVAPAAGGSLPGRVLDMPVSTPTLLTMPLPGVPWDAPV